MFWIIGEQNETTPSAVFKADLEHFAASPAMRDELTRQVYNHTVAELQAVLAPAIAPNEPLFVLAHSGYEEVEGNDTPWIGGRFLADFAPDMVTKFTAAGLSGRTIWFLVCHTGEDVTTLATLLATAGVRNTRIFMPTGFMYISHRGIPHLLPNFDDVDKANQEVAKYDCEFMKITGSQDSGDGWAGSAIDANGTVTALSTGDVKDAVLERFDPDGEGEFTD